MLSEKGWRLGESDAVAATPWRYREYFQGSSGGFSCAKPCCIRLENEWNSDRTVCYFASGKSAVVPAGRAEPIPPGCRGAWLPTGQGLFAFTSLVEAVETIKMINGDCSAHCRAAREFAEAHLDYRTVLPALLEGLSRVMSSSRLRVIVTGLIAQHPLLGGVTWDYLQYVTLV
jgi:hypothetical protein